MSLQQKITQTIGQIRNNPVNQNLRLQLLQFYCLAGQWQHAQKSLNQYLKLNPTDQQTKALFLGNIECELKRLAVMNGDPVAAYLDDHGLIIATQQQLQQQPDLPNTLNDTFLKLHAQVKPHFLLQLNDHREFSDEFIDTDIRFSHVFEIFEENSYLWLSLGDIQSIKFRPTEILTDLIWRRTEIILKNKQSIACFVPVRYPFHADQPLSEDLLYARSTVWQDHGDFSTAVGQKTLSNTEVDIGLLDITSIESI